VTDPIAEKGRRTVKVGLGNGTKTEVLEEALSQALENLRADKLRRLLTMFEGKERHLSGALSRSEWL
jgi:hypothetical protein